MNLWTAIPLAFSQWIFLLVARVVLIVAGLFVVAIALPFRVSRTSVSDGRAIINLPRWAWLWGNDYDGLLGDKRGWWKDNTVFCLPVNSLFAMWWWAAIRNPANNMRRVSLFSCPANKCDIDFIGHLVVEDKPGMSGWRFIVARLGGRCWYGFYFVRQWSAARAFVVQLGFKIKPSHKNDPSAKEKGFTFEVNPVKEI